MGGAPAKARGYWRHRYLLGLVPLVLVGCSALAGNSVSSRNPLLATAKSVRQPTGTTLALPRELNKHVTESYVVEPSDVLLVVAADLDSPVHMPGDQPVLPDGTINLGRYGRLVVAGKTVDEIEVMVRAAVQAHTQGQEVGPFTARVVTRVSKVYYVLGEVSAPGAFPLTGRETVLDGILAAGGLTDRASRSDIILSRPTHPDSCRIVLPICLREIVQLGDTTTNYQLAPGDRIFVASKTPFERLFGSRNEQCLCKGPQAPCASPDGVCIGEAPPGTLQSVKPDAVPLRNRQVSPAESQ